MPWFFFLLIGQASACSGQTDTAVNGISYNFVSRHGNGKIRELGNYKRNSGVRHGLWTFYDSTGQFTEQGAYRNNKKHGRWFDGKDQRYYKKGRYVSTTTVEYPR